MKKEKKIINKAYSKEQQYIKADMLKKKISIDVISEVTGLTIEEIKKLNK